MENIILKELTTGSCGFVCLKYCFYISALNEGIKIKGVGFLPFSSIEKVTSEQSWGLKWIRILHNDSKMYEKVRFISTNPNAWLEMFQNKGIPIDDQVNIRNSDTKWLRIWKIVNLAAGVLGALAAIVAIVACILGVFGVFK
ncbi:MAG: hypothetical protein KCHDKBKB_01913 [Elusimicrobia bacterium]|nr:hypothetical protein [Elusimicrobiota bacterium]